MVTKRLLFALLLIPAVAFADGIVRRGAAIPPDAPRVPLADVLAKPSDFTGRTIVTEGVVEKVCRLAGCWMRVAPEAGGPGLRVTFEDGAFVVPRDSGGLSVRLMGTVRLAENRVAFVASGVELVRPPE